MSVIHPFRAITPIDGLGEYEVYNHFLRMQSDYDVTTKCYEQKVIYINNILEQNLLHLHSDKNFYCCRISTNTFSIIGLIALVEVDAVDKTIFRHERCVNLKRDCYLEHFKKHKTQIAPIILIHEEIEQIKVSLNKIVNQQNPFFSIKDHEYQYDLWKIDDISYYKKLYNPILQFLVADGHHRLSSVQALSSNGLITAFLTSAHDIKSSNIYREYLDVSSISKKTLFSFLDTNFSTQKINNKNDIFEFNTLFFKIDNNIFQIINSDNTFVRQKILEFLDTKINYKNHKLNFYNFLYDPYKNMFTDSIVDVSMLIPALQVANDIRNTPVYPPHSTLFYPKLPEGLVSFHL